MKSIVLLASLLGTSLAQSSTFNTKYVNVGDAFACIPAVGYNFLLLGTTSVPASLPTTSLATFANEVVPTGAVPAISFCSAATTGHYYVVTCDAGFSPTGLSNGQIGVWGISGGTPAWGTGGTSANTQLASNYDFNTNTAFTCVANSNFTGCNFTCSGPGCINSTGFLFVGGNAQAVCAPFFVAVSNTTCIANQTQTIVCTNNPALIPVGRWLAFAEQFPGFSIPRFCSCVADPVCPSINGNSPICSQCYFPCTERRQSLELDLVSERQIRFDAAVVCPPGTITIAQMLDCFRQGACAGAIGPGDICVFGPAGAGQAECPQCGNNGSKKGLLGLLGLLGLIPLSLISLCCLLLLGFIRRRKVERDVHFATFDAGAPHPIPIDVHDLPSVGHTVGPGMVHHGLPGHGVVPGAPVF